MIYKILQANSIEDLSHAVNQACAHDWIPAGGLIAYYVSGLRLTFAQALMSYDSLPPASGTAAAEPHPAQIQADNEDERSTR